MTSHQMTPEQAVWFAIGFPLFFVALWLFITVILGAASGWGRMSAAFPDRSEAATVRLAWQSGSMGVGVRMNGVLRVEVCPSGLRFGMLRLFGPFSRDFFVPWNEIAVTPRRMFLVDMVELQFGGRDFPRLLIRAALADRIAAAAPGKLKLADGVAA